MPGVCPLASVGAAGCVSGFPVPDAFNVVVRPETALPKASFAVAVMVEAALPSATTPVVGVATAVDWLALSAPGLTVVMVVVPTTEPEVAVIVLSARHSRRQGGESPQHTRRKRRRSPRRPRRAAKGHRARNALGPLPQTLP